MNDETDVCEIDLEGAPELDVTLDRIEFPTGDQEFDSQGHKRTVFVYRLHLGEAVTYLPVTMTEEHDDIDDLMHSADLQLYVHLRIFAEKMRRKADGREMTFK